VVSEIISAQWWEPDRPEIRIHGVFVEEAGRGLVVQLSGILQTAATKAQDILTVPVLLGITAGGRLVTLFDSPVLEWSRQLIGASARTSKIWPRLIAYDIHFTDRSDFRITSLSLRYSNLDAWVNTSGFSIDLGLPKGYSANISYSKPDVVEAILPNGLQVGVVSRLRGLRSAVPKRKRSSHSLRGLPLRRPGLKNMSILNAA
jgi:hypothetical protein